MSDIFSFVGKKLFIPPATVSSIAVVAGLNSIIIKFAAGSSLEFGGATLANGNGYLMTLGEVLAFDTRGTFYLAATGATATAYLISGKTDGT